MKESSIVNYENIPNNNGIIKIQVESYIIHDTYFSLNIRIYNISNEILNDYEIDNIIYVTSKGRQINGSVLRLVETDFAGNRLSSDAILPNLYKVRNFSFHDTSTDFNSNDLVIMQVTINGQNYALATRTHFNKLHGSSKKLKPSFLKEKHNNSDNDEKDLVKGCLKAGCLVIFWIIFLFIILLAIFL